MTEFNETYNTDIEMVMDFMRLALLFDESSTTFERKLDIIRLQKSVLEILPVAQSNRMSSVYSMMAEVYRRNKKELSANKPQISMIPLQHRNHDKRSDHFVVLFYKSSCPACKTVMPHWDAFKRQISRTDANFTVVDYDSDDQANLEIFKQFKIDFVPTVIKLRLDTPSNYFEKLNDTVSLDSLAKFGVF